MLSALSITDFAIIDRLTLELGPGLTVITGETGAGKSIIINALNLVLGGRARTEVIRNGADRAVVEALFDLHTAPATRARLLEAGIEVGHELVVRRVLARNGRHRVYLNGTLATLGMLAQVTAGLVDISGQHEHYSLLKPEFHLQILDRVGALKTTRDDVGAAHQAVAALDTRIADLRSKRRDRSEREDFLRFQLQDLEAAELDDPTEEDRLEAKAQRMRNVERLQSAADSAEQELYGASDSATERLSKAIREVRTLADMDESLTPLLDDLNSALAIAEDAARTLGDYARDLSAEPDRLAVIEDRLGLFNRLRRKYGATLAEVISRQAEMRAELATLAGADDALEALQTERAEAGQTLRALAETLTAARKETSVGFASAVCAELADLGMGEAELSVRVEPLQSGCAVGDLFIGPRGADRVEFRLSANAGEPPQPLNRIASGGELSRFMLAVKRVIGAQDPVSTYIFDEVDTGVGGPTAEAIGRKLRAVSAERQALCITHLPQIAAQGEAHFHVSKVTIDDRTRSEITVLNRVGRIEELARMLGGATITKTTRANAKELLKMAGN